MKKALVLFLALVLCFSTVTTAMASDAADDKYIKFVMAGPSDPGNYLPFNADNSVRQTYSLFFYEYLFDLFGTEELRPTIASGCDGSG